MRLDRNISKFGMGKYALVLLRHLPVAAPKLLSFLDENGIEPEVIDFGNTEDSEFFVIRLRDRFAAPLEVVEGRLATDVRTKFGSVVFDAVKSLPKSRTPRLALKP